MSTARLGKRHLREPFVQPPPAWDPRTMGLPPFKFGDASQRSGDQQPLQPFINPIINLFMRGLSAPDTDAWYAFWQTPENWEEFVDYYKGLRRLAPVDEAKVEATMSSFVAATQRHAPNRASEIDNLCEQIAEASRLVRNELKLPLRSDDLQSLERQCIASFNVQQLWVAICMNSLSLLADWHRIEAHWSPVPDLFDGILEVAHEALQDAMQSAYEGVQLRTPPGETVYLTLNCSISPSEDGEGFIGTCDELEQMTCAETRDELSDVLNDLCVGYLVAEQKRGAWPRLLAGLLRAGSEVHPRCLQVRILKKDAQRNECKLAIVRFDLSTTE